MIQESPRTFVCKLVCTAGTATFTAVTSSSAMPRPKLAATRVHRDADCSDMIDSSQLPPWMHLDLETVRRTFAGPGCKNAARRLPRAAGLVQRGTLTRDAARDRRRPSPRA